MRLRQTLARMREDPGENDVFPLAHLGMLHFASVVLIEEPGFDPPQVLFENNVDGTVEEWIDRLVSAGGEGLDALFAASPGYPGRTDPSGLRAWLEDHVVHPGAFHIGATGRTLERIDQETSLREAIEAFLDAEEVAGRLAGASPQTIRTRIQEFVKANPAFGWATDKVPERQTRRQRLMHKARLYAVVPVAILLLPVLAVAAIVLLVKERLDRVQHGAPDPESVARLEADEDFFALNHLSSIIAVKPGILRAAVLRGVLLVINLVARAVATDGKLGGIPSIHFAHWSVINKGRHLVFLSNFDGSWESYLGDFIDKAAPGLTAVWSNTVEFPRTLLLAFRGALGRTEVPPLGPGPPVLDRGLVQRLPHQVDADHRQQLRHPRGPLRRAEGGRRRMAEASVTPELELSDMQGLVARAYGHLPYSRYLLCGIDDPGAARAWLRGILPEVSTASPGDKDGPSLNVAFTWSGLRQLGLGEDTLATFPRALQEGMVTEHRSRILGDAGDSDPTQWRWGNVDGGAGRDPRADHHLRRHGGRSGAPPRNGACRVHEGRALREVTEAIDGHLMGGIEHFGFADGISQPVLKGWPRRTASVHPPVPPPDPKWSEIEPGEVVLGYQDNFGKPAEGPTVARAARPMRWPALRGTASAATSGRTAPSSCSVSWPRTCPGSATSSPRPAGRPRSRDARCRPRSWAPRWSAAGPAGRRSPSTPITTRARLAPTTSATTTPTPTAWAARWGPTCAARTPATRQGRTQPRPSSPR